VIRRALSLAALCVATSAWAADFGILLDPGHTPNQQGALGAAGIHEVAYNDRFAARLAAALRAAGFETALTRQPGQSLGLAERAALADKIKRRLFLSLHHDSAQLAFLEKVQSSHGEAYRTTRPIRGYSIFVSRANPAFADSLRFAELLGESLLNLGRAPTLHHAEDVPGERRELLDSRLGIYRFDELAVLGRNSVPAVLLEVGVIVDPVDEAYVSNPANQDALCRAIVGAVRAYAAQP
jgi:N-acetylmuramoyl-L-alanine amidase